MGETLRIIAVGDSLLNDSAGCWLGQLAARHPHVDFVGEGHGGWTTQSFFRPKFSQLAFNRVIPPADVVMALAGSNDLFEDDGGSAAALDAATRGMERLIDALLHRCPGAEAVVMAPPTVALCNIDVPEPRGDRCLHDGTPGYLRRLSTRYRELAQRRQWRYIDLFPLLDDDDFLDTAHPNTQGNRKIADMVESALQDLLQPLRTAE